MLIFDRPLKPFDESVIQSEGFGIYNGINLSNNLRFKKILFGKLNALIGQ